MTNRKRMAIITFVIGFLLVSPTAVMATPPFPSGFYGNVKINSANVVDGTLVQALINGQVVAQVPAQSYNGDSVFSLNIPGDDSSTNVIEGGAEGDTILFKVGGVQADQIGIWHSGTNENVDLSVTTSAVPYTPESTLTQFPTQTAMVIGQNTESTQKSEVLQTPTEIEQSTVTLAFTSSVETTKSNISQVVPLLIAEDPLQEKSNHTVLLITLLITIVISGLVIGGFYLRKK